MATEGTIVCVGKDFYLFSELRRKIVALNKRLLSFCVASRFVRQVSFLIVLDSGNGFRHWCITQIKFAITNFNAF